MQPRRALLAIGVFLLALAPRGALAQAPTSEVLSFPSIADTYVDAGAATTNFNASAQLLAAASPARTTYLRFAVTGVSGRAVLQARLRLGVTTASTDGGGTVHLITDTTWNETRVTWATRPAVDGPGVATLGPVAAGTVVEFTLDGAIRTDGVYNLAIDSTAIQTAGYTSTNATAGQKPTLVVTVAATGSPTVHVVRPPDGSIFFEGDRITLQATATDAVDGDLGAAVTWKSSLQGNLGTGSSVLTSLNLGSHSVTASVTDRDGLKGTDHVGITVSPRPPANTAPLVAITSPLDGAVFVAGRPITFIGTANDIEDGVLTPLLTWTSDIDGSLGPPGGTVTKALSEGTHTVTAQVKDTAGLRGKDVVTFTVIPAGTLEFPADADAYVDTALPTSRFGGASLLHAYADTARVAYLRFTVANVGSQQVTHAILRLQVDSNSAAGSDDGGTIHTITPTGWQESSITAQTAPPVDGPGVASAGAVTPGQIVDFDVTSAITADGTYDLALVTASLDEVVYRSRESKTPPRLILTITGSPPTVTITGPPVGSVFFAGTPITITGTATDAEDGDLSARIRWTSSLDGTLGTGPRVGPRTLRVGTHTITASVGDADGRTSEALMTLRVRPPNVPPRVTITAPLNGSSTPAGVAVALKATALDDFDGDLGSRVQWTSSRQGPLGIGASRSVVLGEGIHTITAAAVDSDGATGLAVVTVTVTPSPPVLTIASPRQGATLFTGAPNAFNARAIDATDGDLSAQIAWTSNVDGPLGTGGSFTNGALRLGAHVLTATVRDSGGLVAQVQVSVLVRPPNIPPVLALLSPAAGSVFLAGKPVLLAATASDAEDGDLGPGIKWTSSRDGAVGTGALLTVTKLTVGAHVLTATATDRDGATATATAAVTIVPATLTFAAIADTYVDATLPTKALGTTKDLFASGTPVRQMLMRFAVQGLPALPVLKAVVRLTAGTGSADGSPAGGTLSPITDDTWTEARTTWATRPAVDGAPAATQGKVVAKQVVDLDVTPTLHGNGSYDFALTSPSSDSVRYQSRETSAGPKLIVTLDQNTAPLVTILSPASGTKLGAATAVTFRGRALDAESGDVSAQIAWISSLDGALGTGATLTVPRLSSGTHVITATVAQTATVVGRAQITLRVRGPNLPPTVTITSPTSGDSVPAGTAVTLAATATDDWDEGLDARIQWSSSRDGAIGGGPSRTAVLSEGTHTLSATVTDADGASGTAAVVFTVTPTPPVVVITAPTDGTIVVAGTPAVFAGTAGDATDGDLSAAIRWSSDRDGPLGTGETIAAPALSSGKHVVTATVADSGGLLAKARITVVVDAPPTVAVTAPVAGTSVLAGKPVRLVGVASDVEDGDLSAGIVWTSDRDGNLGTGSILTVPALSVGTHTITAAVADRGGAIARATTTVTATPGSLSFVPIADTYVDAGATTGNFGSASSLLVGSGPVRQALLRFAVSGVGSLGVESAVLRLTAGPASADATKVGPSVLALGGAAWSEATTTWTTRPTVTGSPLATAGVVNANQTFALDVTPAIRGDGTFDLALTSASTDFVRVLSRESASGKPELVVGLRQPTPLVTIFQPEAGGSFLTTAPIRFFATAVDPTDGDVAASLTWTSDVDGPIGRGADFTVTGLSPGTHTITAAAANHGSVVGTATVRITVEVATLTFTPTADTYVDELLPLTPFGTAPSLIAVGLPSAKNVLLRFAVTGIGSRTLTDARLTLTVHGTRTSSGGEGGTLHRVTDTAWQEATTTFVNAPPVTGTVLDAVPLPVVQGQQVDFRVGSAITRDGTYSFGLTSASADAAKYDSREGLDPPRLVVAFRAVASTLPKVTITAPAATSITVFDDQPVTFAATAVDPRDGVLSSTIAWRSSVSGALGTGATITLPRLALGTHVVTASVRNRAGQTGVMALTVTVVDRPPAITITRPTDASVFPPNLPVVFTATATDNLDGDLASHVAWTSDRDGALGTGRTLTTATLSDGDHRITATVVNSLGTRGTASIGIAIRNATPRIALSGPPDGTSIPEGTAIALVATANDIEDGDLTGAIVWASSLQGPLGIGGTIRPVLTTIGTHRISATVTDSGGATRAEAVTVVVSLAPPTLTILSPADGSAFSGAVTLSAKAIDFRDGDRSASIRWRSSVGGVLGRGAVLVVPALAFGRHVITADVTDTDGLTASSSVSIAVGNTPPVVTITSPTAGTSVGAWTPVRFEGKAIDPTDGDLSASLRWVSNLSGPIGTGASFTTAGLPRGTHVVTALAAESRGLTGIAQVTIVVGAGPASRPPVVTIAMPIAGARIALGAPVAFSATAVDETGDVSAALVWTSDRDGAIGTGRSFTTSSLSLGSHHLTASASDPGGTVGSASVDVTVTVPEAVFSAVADAFTDELAPATNFGTAPSLQLDAQPVRRIYLRFAVSGLPPGPIQRAYVRLRTTTPPASAGDAGGEIRVVSGPWDETTITHANKPTQDGVALATLGAVDSGQTVELDVTPVITGDGVYSFGLRTASANAVEYVAREAGADGPALVVVRQPPAPDRPSVHVTAPAASTTVPSTKAVIFTATAADAQGVDLGTRIAWRSDRDGALGTGRQVSKVLTPGAHVVTATVTDAAGHTASDVVRVFSAVAGPPVVTITAPAAGVTLPFGTPTAFVGTAFDQPDGDLSSALKWTSDRDGALGTGAAFTRTLSAGTHVITASATDSGGKTTKGTVSVTVNATRVGYEDQSFGPNIEVGLDKATATKPQSKLWFQDGIWWAPLFVQAKSEVHIHRLDVPTQTWVDTGVPVDDRGKSRQDVLVDGQKLYVASRFGFIGTPPQNRLLRYTYAPAAQTYVLDAGFPLNLPGGGAEALTIAKDSRGVLWITYSLNGQLFVAHTLGSDTEWTPPFQPPVSEGTSATLDDDSAVIAMPGGKIGIFWGDQVNFRYYFATHTDGAPDLDRTAWRLEVASALPNVADDHFNLKLAADGRLFVAVKASFNVVGQTEVGLLVRSATGVWSPLYKVVDFQEDATRPICILDEANRRVFVIYSIGMSDIYYKTSSMDALGFPATGKGAPLMVSGTNPVGTSGLNDPSSSKQNPTPQSGIPVLASTSETNRYWHSWIALPTP
jgi:hypothetical protein